MRWAGALIVFLILGELSSASEQRGAPYPFVRRFQDLAQQRGFSGALTFAPFSDVDCRQNIKKVLCLVESFMEDGLAECLPGGEQYAHLFEALHDSFPKAVQKVFCSLDHIFIEKKDFMGTAYAGIFEDGSVVMGFRRSVLDSGLKLSTWASWKEQLSFGGIVDDYIVKSDLPVVTTKSPGRINDFLYMVVAHEFGHILDFANQLNNPLDCAGDTNLEDRPTDCQLGKPGSWGALSWLTNYVPLPENEFTHRDELCFYHCEGETIDRTYVNSIYNDLYNKTAFISTYAATNPWDDFAESLAYYLMERELGTSYVLETRQGHRYDIMTKLKSRLFKAKYDYLENLMKSDGLVYPVSRFALRGNN